MIKFNLVIVLLIFGYSSVSFATPILNTTGNDTEDQTNGAVYSLYQNSGSLLFTQKGNTSESARSVAELQALLQGYNGFTDVAITLADVTYTKSGDGSSGTWESTSNSNTIEFYAVKAGRYFALYSVDPADSTGSWSTFDIWNIGGPGTGGADLEISHFIGYNTTSALVPEPGTTTSAPVPEPGTIILLGTGLVGLGVYGRRKMKILA